MKVKKKDLLKSCSTLIRSEDLVGLKLLRRVIYDDKLSILKGQELYKNPNPIDAERHIFASAVVTDYRNYIDNCMEIPDNPYGFRSTRLALLCDIENMIDIEFGYNCRNFEESAPAYTKKQQKFLKKFIKKTMEKSCDDLIGKEG